MKKAYPLLFLLGLTPFLCQCASQQDMQSMELRMRTMDNRLVDLNQNIDNLENRTTSMAAMSSKMDQLESELLQVKGRVDENGHFFRKAEQDSKDRVQTMQQEYEQRYQMLIKDVKEQLAQLAQQNEELKGQINNQIATLKTDIHQLDTKLGQTQTGLEEIRRNRAKEAAERAAAATRAAQEARQRVASTEEPREIAPAHPLKKQVTEGGKGAASKPAANPAKAVAANGSNNLYDKAYSLFKADRFKEAYNTFNDFISKNPGSSLVPNARFWLGDSLFNQKEYELAILEYQKVIADFPKSSKAPAALLKQGLAFEKLKDKETAKIIYRKLLQDYPRSAQTKTAQTRLEGIK